MVFCCVPNCGADSWKCDGSITFYDFPTNPELSAKWIKQINTAVKTRPMWFPRGKSVICSKHFLHTDFKGDTDSLIPRCIPTVFGHKYIGSNPEDHETNQLQEPKKSPLIVKVIRPAVVLENDSSLRILDVRSEKNACNDGEPSAEIIQIDDDSNVHISTRENVNISNKSFPLNTNTYSKATNYKTNVLIDSQQQSSSRTKDDTSNNVYTMKLKDNVFRKEACATPVSISSSATKQPLSAPVSKPPKKIAKKREKTNNSDLIEIGPNTFLKINPDIIKVNKKQTPSGNTVLQFLMDQKHAKNFSSDQLPKLIQGVPTSSVIGNDNSLLNVVSKSNENSKKDAEPSNQQKETVQHVLGHVVDTHVCEKSCSDLQLPNEDGDIVMLDETNNSTNDINNFNAAYLASLTPANRKYIPIKPKKGNIQKKAETSCIDKAPVLLTTNMPLSHCFVDKPKYILQLKQKTRQIASLKFKINALNKKVEELEDRCIVQERQLSYSFIKRLKSIRKNASKGDPCATYILEQIRSYSNNSQMRWSDSTLTQCSIWCRKAPYAYEYFKKADFFKLPCLGTVKRFIKKHPELKFQRKVANPGGPQNDDDDESSSDFDFDESDDQFGANVMSEDENNATHSGMANVDDGQSKNNNSQTESTNEIAKATESISSHQPELNSQKTDSGQNYAEKMASDLKQDETNGFPTTVDTSNLELQEIMLPSGEVVQCYSASIGNSSDIGSSQYYIIPNVSDQNNGADHEYSVVTPDQLPVLLQNIDTSQLHIQNQEQLIFIANSTGQVECNETEVTSA